MLDDRWMIIGLSDFQSGFVCGVFFVLILSWWFRKLKDWYDA